MTWPVNPSVLVLGAIVAGLGLVAATSWWQRGHTRGARSFTFLALAAAVWVLAEGAQAIATDPTARLTWLQLRVLGVASLPVAFLIFANDDTRRFARLDRHAVALLLVIPAVAVGLAWTYPLNDLFWRDLATVAGRSMPHVGPWWWVHTIFAYAAAGAATVVLVGGRATVRRAARAPTEWTLAGAVAVWIVHATSVAFGPWWGLDPTPFAIALAIAVSARGLLTHRVSDVVPMARDLMLQRSPDPVLVLDAWRRVLQANPAAAEMLDFGAPEELVGRQAEEVLDAQPDLRRAVEIGAAVELAVAWRRDQVERHFRVRTTPLPDRRGRRSGQLLYLQDVDREMLIERERRAVEAELAAQRRYTTELLEALGHLGDERSLEEQLEAVLKGAAATVGTQHAALFLTAGDGPFLERRSAFGRLAIATDAPSPIGDDLAGRAWRERRSVAVADYLAWPERARGSEGSWARAALAVPLLDGSEARGALLLVRPRSDRGPFTADEQSVVAGFARLGALAVAFADRSSQVATLRDAQERAAAAPRSGHPAWRFEVVDLAEVVRHAAGRVCERGGDAVVLDVPSGLPRVVGDRERLVRVVGHLMAMAPAITRGGSVTLSLGRDHDRELGDALVLRIRTTGEGADADALARRFEAPQGGAASVLHAVKRTIERHGGRLWTDASPRGGATVAIVLPVLPYEAAAVAPVARAG